MGLTKTLKKCVKSIGRKGPFGSLIYHEIKYLAASVLGCMMGEERYAKWFYHLYTGKWLNLDDPTYYGEKTWWLKLNNRDPKLTLCSDKYAVRGYVRECGLEDILIPQFDVVDSVEKLDFSKYHDEVVIKCTHNSGGHLFYDPKNPPSEKELKTRMSQLKFILKHNAYVLSREWNYKNIPPKLVIEKLIRDENGNLPQEYKFQCFDGEPKLVHLCMGTYSEEKGIGRVFSRDFYDMDFRLLPVKDIGSDVSLPTKKPKNFERMVEIARRLSQPFPLSRIDLYNVDGKIYFGEITFYESGGCQQLEPEEWDLKMASWIDLNSPKIVRGGGKSKYLIAVVDYTELQNCLIAYRFDQTSARDGMAKRDAA